jgi:GntR family transcriptional regulator/MocR family aminotransferase
MADELGVSRNVVLEAFDQLTAEGYIESRTGSGTFVATGAVYSGSEIPEIEEIKPIGFRPLENGLIDFRSGVPDLNLFPINLWIKLTREVYQAATPAQLAYGLPEGRMELRSAIADYVRVHRGVCCHPEQIVITAGTTQAIGLVSRLLLEGGNQNVVLEDPITNDIQQIIKGFGGRIHPIPVDENGLMADRLAKQPLPAFIYVTPSHQFPLGISMPIQRRVQLLEFATKTGCFILEDDYDSEFRYDAMPINAIQGLDPNRVVYLGTFSKTLCPSLRIGYIIFPPDLIEKGRQLKWFTDLHNATMDQLVLARFIKEGHFARYIVRMKKLQKRKREILTEALANWFGNRVRILGSATGLHLAATFSNVLFNETLIKKIETSGIKIYPVEEHAVIPGRFCDSIIFGYGMLDRKRIEKGVAILAGILAAEDATNL